MHSPFFAGFKMKYLFCENGNWNIDQKCFASFLSIVRKSVALRGPISVDRAIAITRAFKSRTFPLKVAHWLLPLAVFKRFFCLQVASSTTEEPTPPTSPGLEVADSPTWARCVIFEGITFHIFNDLSQKLIVQGRCFLNPHFSLCAGSKEKASCTPAKAFANLQYLWSLQPWVSCFQMLLCLDNVSHILTDLGSWNMCKCTYKSS